MSFRKEHLLFIAPSAYPLGGVSVWLNYLLPSLRRKGFIVTLGLVNGKSHNADAYLQHYPFSDVVKIELGSGSIYSRIRSLADVISKVSPTMVVSVNIPDVYLATRLMRRKKIRNDFRLVSTIHGILPRLFSDLNKYSDVINDVVATNKLTCAMLESETSYSSTQLHYAPYGVEIYPKNDHDTSHERAINILYCGRIDTTQKRCQDLKSIATQLTTKGVNFNLLIAGDGPYRSTLFSELKQFSVVDLGVLSVNEMTDKAYRRADALLLPSEWETGPIVVWEAMAHGVPIVTSRYNGLNSEGALKHLKNCLIFDVGDSAAAADCFQILADSVLREQLIDNGYELLEQRYNREKSVQAWGDVFSSMSQGPLNLAVPKVLRIVPRGRLETWLGVKLGDFIRRCLNLKVAMFGAGDEWPHSHAKNNDPAYQDFYKKLESIEIGAVDAFSPNSAGHPAFKDEEGSV